MCKLPFVMWCLVSVSSLLAQSPHGKSLTMDCIKCHSPHSWKMDAASSFHHDSTQFTLSGQHELTDCKMCHTSLVFSKAESSCLSCHLDMHNQSVGTDCARCHHTSSWLVENITEIHQQNGFTALGAHAMADCRECHRPENLLQFDPIGHECINCHREEYYTATKPNHQQAGYSFECAECHRFDALEWTSMGFDHDFFPLRDGHDILVCAGCHRSEDYTMTSNVCIDCHQIDFQQASEPNHHGLGFSTDCQACHTLEVDWKPATYKDHDAQFFPIYGGEHAGEWNNCKECHTQSGDFASFSCTTCHEHNQESTDHKHGDVPGYSFNSNSCLACHPTGNSDATFDHGKTAFPLTGAHLLSDCQQCHISGYNGTSAICSDCHKTDFDQSGNPNHVELGLSMDCASCHSTDPGWSPATFAIHDQYYVLAGAHAAITADCATCHQGGYSNTPNTCAGCHTDEYNATANPPHQSSGFDTDCASCHSESTWQPANFDHDGQYFPIASGTHRGAWSECAECHITAGNFTTFNCTACHEHNKTNTDNEHQGVSGYTYQSDACFTCHPTGTADGAFDHNTTSFPLTGAHTAAECTSCHADGYMGTSTACVDCHQADFNQASDPSHQTLSLPHDCASCHRTDPGWSPATFAIHDQYYDLAGAHTAIATDCATCHQGSYSNTPNTCAGCHTDEYNATANPPHQNSGFDTDCASCHSESTWQPANFDHDGQYFPIASGTHRGAWSECAECHTTAGNFTTFNCTSCHEHNKTNTDNEHQGVSGYTYQSDACFTCHPTGTADGAFDHNTTSFPLTGAHTAVECTSCHADGYMGTSTVCVDCHQADFNQASDPSHQTLSLPHDCASCHSTDPGWSPATFAIHDQYYVLAGAHTAIATDCATCHQGSYSNTPNTCAGCHTDEYNATANPPHQNSGFDTDCASCHSESTWQPANFDHDGQYFPIASGTHRGAWSECAECHTTAGNFTTFNCTACHEHSKTNTDNEHQGVSGYTYQSDACFTCHPTGAADGAFDHNTTSFPLTGAHAAVECTSCHAEGYMGTSTACVDCHQADFNQASDPSHQTLSLPHDCASCHSTDPGWSPATFAIHDQYYVLAGAHTAIATDCATCHQGSYSNTPNTCAGCHTDEYNATANPPHQNSGFDTDCASCHSKSAWQPANFDHDGQYFPIASGKHQGEWNECTDCHTNANNLALFSCINCHEHSNRNEVDNDHDEVNNYQYNSVSCFTCHPSGD